MNKNNNQITGVGFCGLLTLAFIILKILGIINWSWGWILAPLWIPLSIFILIIVVIFILAK